MKMTVPSKGRIILPAELRQMDRVEQGQEFDIERLDRGAYRLVRRPSRQNEGNHRLAARLPKKDLFVPIESESTDAL